MTPTVALIDENQNLMRSLSSALEFVGFEVRAFADPFHALTVLNHTPADLVVLDMKMPRMDGIEFLGRLRGFFSASVPAIFLGSSDSEIDQVTGLRAGAADYVTKPFNQTVLVEKIRAILRFTKKLENGDVGKTIIRGKLRLDSDRRSCSWDGEAIKLTRSEFGILQALSSRPEIVRSRDELLDVIHGGMDTDTADRTIDCHIKRIRQKFRKIEKEFSNIETWYSEGYCYKEN